DEVLINFLVPEFVRIRVNKPGVVIGPSPKMSEYVGFLGFLAVGVILPVCPVSRRVDKGDQQVVSVVDFLGDAAVGVHDDGVVAVGVETGRAQMAEPVFAADDLVVGVEKRGAVCAAGIGSDVGPPERIDGEVGFLGGAFVLLGDPAFLVEHGAVGVPL